MALGSAGPKLACPGSSRLLPVRGVSRRPPVPAGICQLPSRRNELRHGRWPREVDRPVHRRQHLPRSRHDPGQRDRQLGRVLIRTVRRQRGRPRAGFSADDASPPAPSRDRRPPRHVAVTGRDLSCMGTSRRRAMCRYRVTQLVLLLVPSGRAWPAAAPTDSCLAPVSGRVTVDGEPVLGSASLLRADRRIGTGRCQGPTRSRSPTRTASTRSTPATPTAGCRGRAVPGPHLGDPVETVPTT